MINSMNQFSYATREYDIYPYDPVWAMRFTSMAENLKKIFGEDALDIEHIGSTAVPGMGGKPTVDILVIVTDPSKLDSHKGEIETAGYTYQGQMVAEESRLYREVKNGEILANIHVFPCGHQHILEMLKLRDHLCSHPEDVKEYSELKKLLKQKYPNDYVQYRKQKDQFMDGVLKKRAGII